MALPNHDPRLAEHRVLAIQGGTAQHVVARRQVVDEANADRHSPMHGRLSVRRTLTSST